MKPPPRVRRAHATPCDSAVRLLAGALLRPTHCGREHTVDELRRGLRAEHLRKLHGLVDDDPGRRVTRDAELIKRDTQHVSIDPRHLIDRELRSQLRDLGVEVLAMLQNPFDEVPSERASFFGETRAERAALPRFPGIGAVEIDLEEGLQGEASSRMAPAARRPLAHAADATPSPSASRSRVETARSA